MEKGEHSPQKLCPIYLFEMHSWKWFGTESLMIRLLSSQVIHGSGSNGVAPEN